MFCNYCRASNPNDAIYCSACGRTIGLSIEQSAGQDADTGTPLAPSKTFSAVSSEKVVRQEGVQRQAIQENLVQFSAIGRESLSTAQASIPHGSAPPTDTVSAGSQASVVDSQNIFRHINDLNITRGAALPGICIKCGRPAAGFIRKRIYWHPTWLLLLLLPGFLPYFIVMAIVRKRMDLNLPFCAAHLKKYRLFRVLSPLIVLSGSILLVTGAYLSEGYSGVAIEAGFLILLLGVIFWHGTSTVLKARIIDAEHGVFEGAALGFLDKIPERSQGEAVRSDVSGIELGSRPSLSSANSSSMAAYSSMVRRFVAYFADVVIVYLIVFSVYFASGAFGWKLATEDAEVNLLYFVALFTYMIVAQAAYHTTIGKYILGLEVCSEESDTRYPSFGRILLRETFGRLLSSFLFGAGYWTADKTERNKAWSDRLAGTVVIPRTTNRILVRAFSVFVAVSFVVDASAIGYGLYIQDRSKRYVALSAEITAAAKDFAASRDAVNRRTNDAKPVNDSSDFVEWQEQMRLLKVDLNRYENQIDRMQGLLQRGITEDLASSPAERHQYSVLREVYELRRSQAEKLRQEADLVISCDGSGASMTNLRADLELLDSDIEGLENQSSKRLAEIGIK